MKDKLKRLISNDINVYRFESESEYEYNQRLIYSAGAAWAKTLVYGHSHADDKDNVHDVNADINYVEFHLAKVLEAYLRCFDTNSEWINMDGIVDVDKKARALARQIIYEILYTLNLAEIHSRRLAPLRTEYFLFGEQLYLVRGEKEMGRNIYSVGVAQWVKDNDIEESRVNRKIIDVKGKDYYHIMDSEFVWKRAELQSEYLIFEKGSKRAYSKCWKPIEPADIPQGINILKLKNIYHGGYFLIKRRENCLLIAELDPWYKEEREIDRIMYALNCENNTPAVFQVKMKDGFNILQCSNAIPKYEDILIRCCSWPYKTYDNIYFRIVPSFLWNVVENAILDLGIKVIYKYCGGDI